MCCSLACDPNPDADTEQQHRICSNHTAEMGGYWATPASPPPASSPLQLVNSLCGCNNWSNIPTYFYVCTHTEHISTDTISPSPPQRTLMYGPLFLSSFYWHFCFIYVVIATWQRERRVREETEGFIPSKGPGWTQTCATAVRTELAVVERQTFPSDPKYTLNSVWY